MKLKVRVTSPNRGLSRLARGISNINKAPAPMGMFPSSGMGCGCFCGCCDCGCEEPPPDDSTVCNCEGCAVGIVRRWTLSVGNWTNNTCTECSNATGNFILTYSGQSGTGSTAYCQFLSPAFVYCGRPVRWKLSANCNATTPQSVELIHATLPLVYAQYRKNSVQSGCASNTYDLNVNNSGCNVTASVSATPIGICNCPMPEPGTDCDTAPNIVVGVEYGPYSLDGGPNQASSVIDRHTFRFDMATDTDYYVKIYIDEISRSAAPGQGALFPSMNTYRAVNCPGNFYQGIQGDSLVDGSCITIPSSSFTSGIVFFTCFTGTQHCFMTYRFKVDLGPCP